jgi:hypothetical protein
VNAAVEGLSGRDRPTVSEKCKNFLRSAAAGGMLAFTPDCCESWNMPGDTLSDLEELLWRLDRGDAKAKAALVARAYHRLQRLARRQMGGFKRLRRFQDADDVVQNACLRMLRRLEGDAPTNAGEFFAWAAREIRCELLDLARSHYGPLGAGRREASVPREALTDKPGA